VSIDIIITDFNSQEISVTPLLIANFGEFPPKAPYSDQIVPY